MMNCPICGKRCEETRDTNREAVAVCDGCGAIWRLETAMEGYYAVRKMLAQAEAERDQARSELALARHQMLRMAEALKDCDQIADEILEALRSRGGKQK